MNYRNSIDIGCPVCKTRLRFIDSDRYETLHPNNTVSKKDSFGCPNENCLANVYNLKWIESGEGYYGKFFDHEKAIKFIDGNKAPFRTYTRQMNAEREFTYSLLKTNLFIVELGISAKADFNGKRKFNRYYNLKLYISDGSGFVLYQSGMHMFIFDFKHYLRSKNRQNEFKNHIQRLKSWDKRWWSKLSFTIAKLIWRGDYQKAITSKI